MNFLGGLRNFGRKLGGSITSSIGQTLGAPIKLADGVLKFGDDIIGRDEMDGLPGVVQGRKILGKAKLVNKASSAIGTKIDPHNQAKGYNLFNPLWGAQLGHDITSHAAACGCWFSAKVCKFGQWSFGNAGVGFRGMAHGRRRFNVHRAFGCGMRVGKADRSDGLLLLDK